MTTARIKSIHIGDGLYARLIGANRYSITADKPEDTESHPYGEVCDGIPGYVLQNLTEELWSAKYLRIAADFVEWLDCHDGKSEGFPEPSEILGSEPEH